jgi:hypothetical protein
LCSTTFIIATDSHFLPLYQETLAGNDKGKFAFLVHDMIHSQLNATFQKSHAIMKGWKLTVEVVIPMSRNHFILDPLNHVISRFTPAGIPKYLADYGRWYYHRPLPEKDTDTRRVLSLIDLEFGFVLFLAAAGFSLLVFFGELLWQQLWLKMARKLKILIGLVDFLRALNERMQDYHDRW